MWPIGFVPAASCSERAFLLKPFPGCWQAPGFQELQKAEGLGEFVRTLTQSRHVVSKTGSAFPQLLAEGLLGVRMDASTCVDRLTFSLWFC